MSDAFHKILFRRKGALGMLKRLFQKGAFLLAGLLFCLASFGQKAVSYVHDPFSENSCIVIMAPALSQDMACLVVSVVSEQLSLGDRVHLELESMDGQTLSLEGMSLGLLMRLGQTPASGIMHPEGMEHQAAQFSMDGAAIGFLEKGIRRIFLDTLPLAHEKTFKKDKVGKKLFKGFRSLGVILN